jgi:MOSC domain-containing protein YiiM
MKNGQITHIFIKPGKGAEMKSVQNVRAVKDMGLENDQAYGKKNRQILLIEKETLMAFGLQPGQIRENVVVEDLVISNMPSGTKLKSGEVLLEITGDCAPCDYLNSVKPGLMDAIRGRRGMFATVLAGGTLQVASNISIVE